MPEQKRPVYYICELASLMCAAALSCSLYAGNVVIMLFLMACSRRPWI